jgi:hypothetical protein
MRIYNINEILNSAIKAVFIDKTRKNGDCTADAIISIYYPAHSVYTQNDEWISAIQIWEPKKAVFFVKIMPKTEIFVCTEISYFYTPCSKGTPTLSFRVSNMP